MLDILGNAGLLFFFLQILISSIWKKRKEEQKNNLTVMVVTPLFVLELYLHWQHRRYITLSLW